MSPNAVVVDDDAASASVIAKLLARIGCEVSVCIDAERAVSMALDGDVDFVSLDLTMPALDGYQVLSLLRSHEHSRRLPSLPVITITGKVSAEDRAASLAAGFAAHLGKPVLLTELRHALEVALTLRGELYRTRYSVDQARIEERLQVMLSRDNTRRLGAVAGLALAVEQQGSEVLLQSLVDVYAGNTGRAVEGVEPLLTLGDAIGAAHLCALCRGFAAVLPLAPPAFERAAVLARAELDRVVYTLREQALA